jgi:branched-chain amino acid transport system permease protein
VDIVLQQMVNAASLGSIYALLALGLAVVFAIVGLINFAHGEVMTIAGYGALFALTMSFPLAGVVAFAIAAALIASLAMERIAFRPLRGADVTTLLITSFAVSEIVKVLLQNGISARVQAVVLPSWLSSSLAIGPVVVGVTPLISIGVTAVALVGLVLFLRNTMPGRAMRAAADDFQMLRAVGYPANRVIATAFLVAGFLAAIAAMLWVAQRGSVDPLMGFVPVLKAFIAVVLGGLGSLVGAVAGGFLLGAIEVGLQASLPDSAQPFRDAIALGLVIAVLLVRPNGLLPARSSVRS